MAGQSAVVTNAIANQPSQGHLGLDDRGRVVVQWVSGSGEQQQALWGTSPQALSNKVLSTAVTYTAAQMCGAPANSTGWLNPGWQHRAVLPVDPAGAGRIHYRFGSDAAGWSDTRSFSVPSQPGQPTKFLVFNDVGMSHPVLFNDVCPPYCPAGYTWSREFGL